MGGSASPEEADGGWGGRREPLGTEHVGACTGQFLHRYLFLLWNCFEILATTASIFFLLFHYHFVLFTFLISLLVLTNLVISAEQVRPHH